MTFWSTLLEEILEFINKSQLETNNSKKNILIHCFMGSSRSASCVILYLMNKYEMTFEESYNMIKKLRPIVNPNTSFVKQLKNYVKN